MNLIPYSSIIIPAERQRQEFEPNAMQELKASIERLGLMHAPVLRKTADGWTLVAGERRLRTIVELRELGGLLYHNGELIPGDAIPYVDIGTLSDLEVEEAELDENLKRKDLTWQEHAAATARLHKLRQDQKTQTAALTATAPEKQTVADTALELKGRADGAYQDAVRKEIIVSRHLTNPLIAKAKSADEAFKILQQQEVREKNIALANQVGATFNADVHQLLLIDCLEHMRSVSMGPEEKKFDVICTDPLYGMGADSFGDAGGKLSGIEHHYDDSEENWRRIMTAWAPLAFAVTKPQAHAYVFCDFDRFHELKALMQAAGWYVFRTPMIAHKPNSGRVPLPDQGPRRQYEIILYAIKGKKRTTHIYPDVISTNADENLSHGAQKPVALFQNLLQRSVVPGDRVLDSFAGTGTIFEAAHNLRCYATGTENSKESYGISLTRLQKLKALEQPALF